TELTELLALKVNTTLQDIGWNDLGRLPQFNVEDRATFLEQTVPAVDRRTVRTRFFHIEVDAGTKSPEVLLRFRPLVRVRISRIGRDMDVGARGTSWALTSPEVRKANVELRVGVRSVHFHVLDELLRPGSNRNQLRGGRVLVAWCLVEGSNREPAIVDGGVH